MLPTFVNQQDYYAILGLQPNASIPSIAQAYRDLALKYHPTLHHENPNDAYTKFCEVSQAFDVLFDSQKRAIYDQHGQKVLKEGVGGSNGQLGKYKIITKPQQIFEKFFGSSNVYDHLLVVGKGESISHPIFSGRFTDKSNLDKVHDLIVPVECTLSQIFNGCNKTLSYQKKILTSNGQNSTSIVETKKIQILPGTTQDTPIVFQKQGHQEPGYQHSRLIFQIVQIPQKNFQRQQNDLIYTANITLMQALDSVNITITHLDGQTLQMHFDQIISPQTRRVIPKKGMPILRSSQKGDLIVRFNIEFPQELDLEKKTKIIQLLKQ